MQGKIFFPKIIPNILKWYFSAIIMKKPFPLVCNIWITNRCNFRCKFCYQDFDAPSKTLSENQFKMIVDDLSKMGTIYLYISGGEPLLVENIEERIEYAAKKIPYVHMVSNGFLLNEEKARRLAKTGISEISVSLDGMEATHTKYRGNEKAFANALKAINNIKTYAPNISITCSTMVAPWNIDDQLKLMELCYSLKIKQRLTAFEDFPVVKKNYINDFDITDEFLGKLRIFLNNYSKYNNDRFLKFIEAFFVSKIHSNSSNELDLFKEPCLVPSFYLNILEDGRISPCHIANEHHNYSKENFNINNSSLKEVILSREYRILINNLKSCDYCKDLLSSCYIRPRLVFPLTSFLKYTLYPRIKEIFNFSSKKLMF